MMRIVTIGRALTLLVALAAATPALAQDDPIAKEQDLRLLMQLAGPVPSVEPAVQAAEAQLPALLAKLGFDQTNATAAFNIMHEEILAAAKKHQAQMAQDYENFYGANLSYKDIRDLLAFYQSPLGERFTKTLPSMAAAQLANAGTLGEQLQQEALPAAIQRMRQQGIAARGAGGGGTVAIQPVPGPAAPPPQH